MLSPYERRRIREGMPYWRIRKNRVLRAGTLYRCDWWQMRAHYGRCLKCGVPSKETWEIQKDHIVAICKGGRNTIYNVQPLCFRCNWHKKHSDSTDYRMTQPDTRLKWLTRAKRRIWLKTFTMNLPTPQIIEKTPDGNPESPGAALAESDADTTRATG